MKKAKLMLSTMALFAILATAFAFKANDFSNHVVFTGSTDTNVNPNGACTSRTEARDLTTNTANGQILASVASKSTGCPITYTVAVENIP